MLAAGGDEAPARCLHITIFTPLTALGVREKRCGPGSFAERFNGSGSCVRQFNGGCLQSLKEGGKRGITLQKTHKNALKRKQDWNFTVSCGGFALLKQLLELYCDSKVLWSLDQSLPSPNRVFWPERLATGHRSLVHWARTLTWLKVVLPA